MAKAKKKVSDIVIGAIVIIIAVLFVLALGQKIWGLFNKDATEKAENVVEMEEIDKLVNKNIDLRYPETPNGVVELYASITKELHSGEADEEQISKLFAQMRKLMDEELLANNDYDKHFEKLNAEIKNYKANKMTISRYVVEESDVTIYTDDEGKDCTKVGVSYSIKKANKWLKSNELVILRKDGDGRWKILGNEEAETAVGEDEE